MCRQTGIVDPLDGSRVGILSGSGRRPYTRFLELSVNQKQLHPRTKLPSSQRQPPSRPKDPYLDLLTNYQVDASTSRKNAASIFSTPTTKSTERSYLHLYTDYQVNVLNHASQIAKACRFLKFLLLSASLVNSQVRYGVFIRYEWRKASAVGEYRRRLQAKGFKKMPKGVWVADGVLVSYNRRWHPGAKYWRGDRISLALRSCRRGDGQSTNVYIATLTIYGRRSMGTCE
ncbi:hypothetical protein FPV67DRAFT_1675773 [Lyophyllum atratum]|nr:hypothetical protein FPV67DRAFT_1683434 [Lyophyllum atratum]KAF8059078.1 hypothetical protein FPV67DRAFT_1675773 [Lyophyllum atratum]